MTQNANEQVGSNGQSEATVVEMGQGKDDS